MSKVINFNEAKKTIEEDRFVKAKRVELYDNLEKEKDGSNFDYNHRFYELVDLFMQETYPDYAWRFDVWLDKIKK